MEQPEDRDIATYLDEGDHITVSITSVVKVNRHDNWIKLEIQSAKRSEESDDRAMTRVLDYTTAKFEQVVMTLVDKIMEMDS